MYYTYSTIHCRYIC